MSTKDRTMLSLISYDLTCHKLLEQLVTNTKLEIYLREYALNIIGTLSASHLKFLSLLP